ncbi:MFS transporter [Amycolatopsis taiwanensis]|nr:MFS transporter [Amycolatopsis taiwanensis]
MVIDSQTARARRARPGLLLMILGGAPFLAGLDLFVVNVAFGDIATSFPGHSLADLSWILNGYAIIYAAALIPIGRWADKVGRKRVFLLGLGLFTLASLAAAASPDPWTLVVLRLCQALGAAALTPASLGLLIHAVPPDKRAGAVRVWAAVGALASAFGPVVGGLLAELSWRWIFVINVPVGIVLLVLALRVIDDPQPGQGNSPLDPTGVALLTVGIGALALGLVQGRAWGWSSAGILASFAVAVVALIGFAINNARHRTPLIEPALFRVHSFTWSNVAALLFNASFAAGLLAVILWLQNVWSYSAIQTGLAIAPGPLMVPIFALGGQAVAKRVRAGALAAVGSALWALGIAVIGLSAGRQPHYVTGVLPGWLIAGIGVGLAMPTILSSATAHLPPTRSATGSAIVNMTRQIGMVLGISVLIVVLGGFAEDFGHAWLAVVVIGLLAALAAPGMSSRKGVSPTSSSW